MVALCCVIGLVDLPDDDRLGRAASAARARASFAGAALHQGVTSRWHVLHNKLHTLLERRKKLQAAHDRATRNERERAMSPPQERVVWSWNRKAAAFIGRAASRVRRVVRHSTSASASHVGWGANATWAPSVVEESLAGNHTDSDDDVGSYLASMGANSSWEFVRNQSANATTLQGNSTVEGTPADKRPTFRTSLQRRLRSLPIVLPSPPPPRAPP